MPRLLRGFFGETFIVTVVIGGLWLYSAALAHGAASVPKHVNSVGVVQYQENPNTYLQGSISSGDIVHVGMRYGTNIRFQPAHTYGLFDQTILFCGNRADAFNGHTGPIVITYKTRAAALIGGVACHELVGIDNIAPRQELP